MAARAVWKMVGVRLSTPKSPQVNTLSNRGNRDVRRNPARITSRSVAVAKVTATPWRCPRGNLIFVTEFPQYMGEAFDLHASGYRMKPVTVPEVQRELADLRYPVQEEAPLLRVQAFGNFEVFFQGRPVHFRRSRTKELFAYLIDRRGAGSTMGELISILWEGRLDTPGVRSQLRSLITDLRTTLQALGQEAVIIKRRDLIAVDPKQVDCDYYRFLAGDRSPGNLFRGEYMSNYSWGETTLGALTGEDP